MKKILFFALALVFSVLSSFSQNKLELTPKGLTSVDDPKANYLIFEKKGSQKELFNNIMAFVGSMFVSPKDVLSSSEYEVITINGITSKGIEIKKLWGGLPMSVDYTIVFFFKDDKIRVNIPSINKMQVLPTNGNYPVTINQYDNYTSNGAERLYIFNKKGELKNSMAKGDLENFFNTFIDKAINYTSPVKEDW